MNSATSSFIQYWQRFVDHGDPYVHPDDIGLVSKTDFELRLLPMPINGNLEEAEVIILMLNPGLDAEDYHWETIPRFREGLLRNIQQQHETVEYPFLYLDPEFQQHAGAGYWSQARTPRRPKQDKQKLRTVIQALAHQTGRTLEDTQHYASQSIAVLQLCPYHSATMKRRDLLRRLPSSIQARALVKQLIEEDEKLVVATRSVKEWGFSASINSPNLVVYPKSHGLSASLAPTSAGGRAILAKLSGSPAPDSLPSTQAHDPGPKEALQPIPFQASNEMEQSKAAWLDAIDAVRKIKPTLEVVRAVNQSPIFKYGLWTFAVEHTKGYKSLVIRCPTSMKEPDPNWQECGSSDQGKNWQYRAKNQRPEDLHLFLLQLEAAEK